MPPTADTLKKLAATYQIPWSSLWDPDIAMLLEAAADLLKTKLESCERYALISDVHEAVGQRADDTWHQMEPAEQDAFFDLKADRKARVAA